MSMSIRHLLVIAGLALALPAAGPEAQTAGPEVSLEIKSQPILEFDPSNPSRRRFGELEFRGGLILTSGNRNFGGFSALRVQADGSRFLALTDHGYWLRGRIVYEGNRPAAIADAVMAPVLYEGVKPAGRLDTESITEDRGVLYVGVERINQILRFEYGQKGFQAVGEPIAIPAGIKDLPNNQGLESLVAVPRKFALRGALIAISECGLNEAGDLKAFLIGGPTPGDFWVKRTGGYDISDAALAPDGDILILERRYSPAAGVAIRIRRVPLSAIKPGATVDGPVIFEADARCVIDNAEALSVHRAAAGEVVLTLLTDDNFLPIQRTLLLQFTLLGDGASKLRPRANR